MKKLFAILLALLLAVCPALAEDSAEADWSAYDALVDSIKAENDPAAREALMHEAEAMLMDTGAVVPITYYTDPYMMKTGVEGVYGTIEGFKYFMYATYEGADTLRINLASEPGRLDPALLYTVDGACLAVNSFAGLYTHAADGTLQPELAAGYTVSDDGLTYTFTLREGLTWSDGEPPDGGGLRLLLAARRRPGQRRGVQLSVQHHRRLRHGCGARRFRFRRRAELHG